jgi:hypothetical protein
MGTPSSVGSESCAKGQPFAPISSRSSRFSSSELISDLGGQLKLQFPGRLHHLVSESRNQTGELIGSALDNLSAGETFSSAPRSVGH